MNWSNLEIIKKVLRTRSDTMISVSCSRVDGIAGLAFRPSREIQFDGIALVKERDGCALSETDFAPLGNILRAARVQRRFRRGFDQDGKRILEGIEIVKTYRVLDGIAGVEMPTSTVKSRLVLRPQPES